MAALLPTKHDSKHHCGFSYLRLSMLNSAIPSFPRAQIQRVRTITRVVHIGLRSNAAVTTPRAEYPPATTPADTNTAATPPSGSRDTDAGLLGNRPTGTKLTGGPSGRELLFRLEGFIAGLMAIIIAALLWIMVHDLFPDNSRKLDDCLKRAFQETVIFKPKGVGIDHESGASRGVWSRLVNILGYLTYCWDNDPAWYPGSVLSKIIPVFRDVSLYTVAIVLAVYMIF